MKYLDECCQVLYLLQLHCVLHNNWWIVRIWTSPSVPYLSFTKASLFFEVMSPAEWIKVWTTVVIVHCVLAKASCSAWDHCSMIPAENQWLFPTCNILTTSWGYCRLLSVQIHFKGDSKFRLLWQQSSPRVLWEYFPAAATLPPLSTVGSSSSSILSPLIGSSPFFCLRA